MTAVTLALVKTHRGAPDRARLRRALRKWAFNPPHRNDDQPKEITSSLQWLRGTSVPISALEEASVLTRALDACATKLDGSSAAPEYYRRRRRVFYNALKYAVREKRLSANPLDDLGEADWEPPEVGERIDPRRVANPAQIRALLEAIRGLGRTQGPRMVALFGCALPGWTGPRVVRADRRCSRSVASLDLVKRPTVVPWLATFGGIRLHLAAQAHMFSNHVSPGRGDMDCW
ncbi:MAG: hypothetical protein ACRDQA_24735 [Nocardioidaceae bacterium]